MSPDRTSRSTFVFGIVGLMFSPATVSSVSHIHASGCEKDVGLGKDGKQIGFWELSFVSFCFDIIGNSTSLVPPDCLVLGDHSSHTEDILATNPIPILVPFLSC